VYLRFTAGMQRPNVWSFAMSGRNQKPPIECLLQFILVSDQPTGIRNLPETKCASALFPLPTFGNEKTRNTEKLSASPTLLRTLVLVTSPGSLPYQLILRRQLSATRLRLHPTTPASLACRVIALRPVPGSTRSRTKRTIIRNHAILQPTSSSTA